MLKRLLIKSLIFLLVISSWSTSVVAQSVVPAVNSLITIFPAVNDAVNVKTYCGAVGDGSTDDTTAINNCISTYAIPGNRCIYFPVGKYKVSTLSSLTANNTYTPCFYGDNDNASVLSTNNSTAIILNITGIASSSYIIHDLGFTSSVARINNGFVQTTGSKGYLSHLRFNKCFYCLDVSDAATQASNIWFEEGEASVITSAQYIRVGANIPGPGGNACSYGCNFDGMYTGTIPSTQPLYGFNIISSSSITIVNSQLLTAGKCINITPTFGSVSGLTVADTWLDHCSYGLYVNPTGSASVLDIHFTNVRGTNSTNDGIHIENSGTGGVNTFTFNDVNVEGVNGFTTTNTASDIQITNSIINFNSGRGILIQRYADAISIQNNTIGSFFSSQRNGSHGIEIGAQVGDFKIVGNTLMNNNGWGILINSGAGNNYIMTNNLTHGNTSGGISNSATGTNAVTSQNINY